MIQGCPHDDLFHRITCCFSVKSLDHCPWTILLHLVMNNLLNASNLLFFIFLVSIGKNQPLKAEKPKWKSDIPLTDGQLKSKRDEFWDTAPVFEVS